MFRFRNGLIQGSVLSLSFWLCFWMILSAALLASSSGLPIVASYSHILTSQSPKGKQMSSYGRSHGGQSTCLSQKCQKASPHILLVWLRSGAHPSTNHNGWWIQALTGLSQSGPILEQRVGSIPPKTTELKMVGGGGAEGTHRKMWVSALGGKEGGGLEKQTTVSVTPWTGEVKRHAQVTHGFWHVGPDINSGFLFQTLYHQHHCLETWRIFLLPFVCIYQLSP